MKLKDKFTGCIAASWIGSSMGAAVEGWSRERIKQEYGFFDKLVRYKHYTSYTDWVREPGTTEDGIERQKLIATTIIEKKDHINAHDLVRTWLRDLNPDNVVYKQEQFDKSLLEMARAGVPPIELGRLWPFPNVISMGRASHPIGLINAGDPVAAAEETIEVGKVYAPETAFALRWAALYNASIAEACKENATVESVIDTAKKFATYRKEAGELYSLYDTIEMEVDRAFEIAAKHSDPVEMRDEFYQHYDSTNFYNYAMSQANEIIAKGLAVFALTKGSPKASILVSVNFGRDTDCLAAISGGLSGAFSGHKGLDREWIDQVNEATRLDPYTNNKRTIEETADGLYEAYLATLDKKRAYLELMSGAYAS